ncbi:MAG: ATP-binding cassette domain-containing protein [Gemmatimonadaceae bacterium]
MIRAAALRPSPAVMSPLALDIRHVVKRYASHTAVRDLSLAVPVGAVYGLLGPNGAGKTTTIRMVLNVIAPDEGTIRLFGERADARGMTDRIGYLPEERGLYKKMQVRRLLRFLAELKGVSRAIAEPRISEWLERLSLKTAAKDWGLARVDELSRGMQQKVQFIATLIHDPDLIILDEPFSGLDPINAQALKDTIGDLKRRGKTVIFSTHLMDNAERMCDSVCIIAGGAKVLDGTVEAVKAAHGARRVALDMAPGPEDASVRATLRDPRLVEHMDDGDHVREIELADGADPQELLRRLVEGGARIRRFELVHPSLHEVFLRAVGASTAATRGAEHA